MDAEPTSNEQNPPSLLSPHFPNQNGAAPFKGEGQGKEEGANGGEGANQPTGSASLSGELDVDIETADKKDDFLATIISPRHLDRFNSFNNSL